MALSLTEAGRYCTAVRNVKMRFTVKEGGRGELYIVMEPADVDPPLDVQLHLGNAIDMDGAHTPASLLNKCVERVRFE
jgi:hypothetical protein